MSGSSIGLPDSTDSGAAGACLELEPTELGAAAGICFGNMKHSQLLNYRPTQSLRVAT
jgi:hypothetical protein